MAPGSVVTFHRRLDPFPRGHVEAVDATGRRLLRLGPAETGWGSIRLHYAVRDGSDRPLYEIRRGVPPHVVAWDVPFELRDPSGQLLGEIRQRTRLSMQFELRSTGRVPLRAEVSASAWRSFTLSQGPMVLARGRLGGWAVSLGPFAGPIPVRFEGLGLEGEPLLRLLAFFAYVVITVFPMTQ